MLPAADLFESRRLGARHKTVLVQPAAPYEFADIHVGVILQMQAGVLHTRLGIEGQGEVPK